MSEKDYLQAWRLRVKVGSKPRLLKTVMFWVFILVCLMLLWVVVAKYNSKASPAPEDTEPVAAQTGSSMNSFLWNIGPFVALGGVWAFMLVGLAPMRVRRQHRKDPLMQGEFSVKVTPDSFSMENTAGSSWNSVWGIYEYWREGKDVVILGLRSGTFFILGLASLSEAQRAELRGILGSSLPKK
ncbi:MAG: YcxB family protein [Terracidiphilus sp.]